MVRPVSWMMSPRQRRIDSGFMSQALKQAQLAYEAGEVPVGALLVFDGRVIGAGHNRCITDSDPSAHAEVVALRQAAKKQSNYRLDGATLYVTLEPCLMCCGALLQARIARLVFGVREPRTGAVVSQQESLRAPWHDHHVAITEGIDAEASAQLLTLFFRQRRSE